MKLKSTSPISGKEEDLTDPKTWIQNILGVFFLFVVFAFGQKVAQTVEKKTKLDTSPEFTVNSPMRSAAEPNFRTY